MTSSPSDLDALREALEPAAGSVAVAESTVAVPAGAAFVGEITVEGKSVPVGALSSYSKALEIANLLKEEIERGEFLVSEPLCRLPPDGAMKSVRITEKPS